MIPQELIRRTRDGQRLSAEEIGELVDGITHGGWSDAQVAAWAMAVFQRGLSQEETVALTLAMRDSGTVLDWSAEERPVLDKHSTGGVGDKVSLVLAPLVAACGGAVPMISGRGLGHTGGTLDKLEAIPGYDATPGEAKLREAVHAAGCAIVGQTAEVAPADRRLYALRDATATVECLPLIVASILSKKLAAGLQALIMDVKTGSGAFLEDARPLADALVEVAEGAGLGCRAHLTDMDQVLGRTAGNAVEVREAIAMLRGEDVEPRLRDVTMQLSRALVELGGLDPAGVDRALESGEAADRFARMVVALGGPADLLERPDAHLPEAPVVRDVPGGAGTVRSIDVREVGLAVVELGGGRLREDQPELYDLSVGLLRTVEDYRDLVYEYLVHCAAQGAVYVELTASPDHAAHAGLSDEEHVFALARGIDDARLDTGIEARVIMTCVRNFGVEQAEAVARRTVAVPHPYVVGFGIAGDEAGFPPGPFARAFAIAHDAGLGCIAHAGEWAGPESVRGALALPGVTRIGHGVRAVEDPALVDELVERGTVLEVCPTSNVVLGVFASYAEHPLRRLYDAGVKVTLASDDPPYWGASVGGEYAVAQREFGFTDAELLDVTRTAIEAAFAEDALKTSLSRKVSRSAL